MPSGIAVEARDGMAGAMSAAGRLADQAIVLAPAREAFTSGLHAVSIVGATFVILFAVIGMVVPRKRSRPEPEPAACTPEVTAA